jgi:hypothetical protein
MLGEGIETKSFSFNFLIFYFQGFQLERFSMQDRVRNYVTPGGTPNISDVYAHNRTIIINI